MTTELWPQEIWLCHGSDCGLRFPARQGDTRATSCPLCLSETTLVETFNRPPASQPASDSLLPELTVVLDNIRSANNVGSILRTADAVGAKVILCGFTATPDNPKVAKTSLGAHETIEWSQHRNCLAVVKGLQAAGTTVWALEATETSSPLSSQPLPNGPLALVVGNEVSGVDPAILRSASKQVHLPMVGQKTSLNVAVAMGAATYILRESASGG